MRRIGLLSDTHGYLDEDILHFLRSCDEIWHAGDFGPGDVADELRRLKRLRGVYGNIDDLSVRAQFPENLVFEVEGLKVAMTHIGGYPGKYPARIKKWLLAEKPGLFICGHSHILKIMPDRELGLLHINPGACGQEGFHLMRTLVRFTIHEGRIEALEAIELGRRGSLKPKG
jgi:putative phosphoesterase